MVLGKPPDTIEDIAGLHIKIKADGFKKALHTLVLHLHYLVAFDDWVEGFPDPGLLLLFRLLRIRSRLWLWSFLWRAPRSRAAWSKAASKVCEEWRQTHLLEKLDWPANSLDLNPIENLWKILKDVVQDGSICPKNLDDLKVVIERE